MWQVQRRGGRPGGGRLKYGHRLLYLLPHVLLLLLLLLLLLGVLWLHRVCRLPALHACSQPGAARCMLLLLLLRHLLLLLRCLLARLLPPLLLRRLPPALLVQRLQQQLAGSHWVQRVCARRRRQVGGSLCHQLVTCCQLSRAKQPIAPSHGVQASVPPPVAVARCGCGASPPQSRRRRWRACGAQRQHRVQSVQRGCQRGGSGRTSQLLQQRLARRVGLPPRVGGSKGEEALLHLSLPAAQQLRGGCRGAVPRVAVPLQHGTARAGGKGGSESGVKQRGRGGGAAEGAVPRSAVALQQGGVGAGETAG